MKQKIFITAFLLMLVLPFPLYALLHGVLDTTNYENRTFATWQSVADAPLRKKPAAFETWLNDHAAFRNQFMTLHAGLNYKLFHTVQSGEVLLGKEDWLFYKNVSDSKSIDDYQGLNVYSEAQMQQIAVNLNDLQAALARRGTQLCVLIAPNKEGVFAQYMPESIPVVAQNRTDLLAEYVQKNTQVPFVYPKKALQNGEQTYFKYDTHWNDAGAAIATNALLAAMGRAEVAFSITPSDEKAEKDLANIAAIYNTLPPDQNFTAAPRVECGETYDETVQGSGTGTLLMLRDSFGAAMMPLVSTQFAESRFVHLNAFEENTFAQTTPDVFVFEVAERNIDRLLDYLPRLTAWING